MIGDPPGRVRSGRVRDAPTPMAAALAGTVHGLPALDETRIRRSTGPAPSAQGVESSVGAGRARRAHRQSGPQISRSADGVIRRDFLADEIRKRRGGATGMDAEDLERETATERFVAGRGSRETAKAQTVSADPMVDRLEIQGAVSTRQRLGAQGLPQLLEQGRERRAQHDASMHELGDGTESVASSLQQTRIGMDSYYARYGEEVTEQRQLTRSLDDVRSAVQEASAVAQWDATQLGEFESAAASAVKALRPGSQSETDARGSFDAARAKVAAAVSRAQQDSQWMESLLPHTEAIIEEAIGAGNKTVMPDRTRLATVAKLAKGSVAALLRITKKRGKPAQTDFVLDGEGCSPLDIVDRYLQADQVWLGETAPAPTLRPNGTTYDQIESVAVPKLKDGSGPAVGGYAGNREWANSHGA